MLEKLLVEIEIDVPRKTGTSALGEHLLCFYLFFDVLPLSIFNDDPLLLLLLAFLHR
jgi:hypothetical protein